MKNSVDLKFIVDTKQLDTANSKLDVMQDNLKDVTRQSNATATKFKGVGKQMGHTFQMARDFPTPTPTPKPEVRGRSLHLDCQRRSGHSDNMQRKSVASPKRSMSKSCLLYSVRLSEPVMLTGRQTDQQR